MVFYRKYRPQTISELDLSTVREKLTSILEAKEIPHAFLFSGPKGLGKTSAARILAKAINCEKRSKIKDQRSKTQSKNKKEEIKKVSDFDIRTSDFGNIEPCNECSACISITNGSNMDVLEIDAASNRGIDEIRALREGIKFSPVSLPYKVYIIDEVHMLTTEAFNALLKTLEEPPSHALFVLCTTEPWKLPSTVVSRALHVLFEKPSYEELARSLQRVVAGEKLNIADGVLENIFDLSEGAFRDAHKLLEELALLSNGKRITIDLLERTYKTKSIDHEVIQLLHALAQKDAKEALLAVDRLSQAGCDFRVVTEKIVEVLRGILFEKSGLSVGAKLIHPRGVKFTIESTETLLGYFNQAYKDIRFSVLPQLPLELAIIQWCVVNKVQSSEEEKTVSTRSDLDTEFKAKTSKSAQASDDFMKQLIELVKKENHSIAGILRGCNLLEIKDGAVYLQTSYKFHKDKLSEKKTREVIEKRASEILGKEVTLSIKMSNN